jgi:hypothetical protein
VMMSPRDSGDPAGGYWRNTRPDGRPGYPTSWI